MESLLQESPVPLPRPQVTIPADMDLSCFDQLTDEELLQEARAKEDAIATAELDKAMIIEVLTRRVTKRRQTEESGHIEGESALAAA